MTEMYNSLLTGTADLLRSLAANAPRLALGIVVFIAGLFTADLVRRAVYRASSRTMYGSRVAVGLSQVLFAAIVTIAVLVSLTIMGIDIGSLVAGLGLTSLAIGFALRDILENTSAGILLSFSQPFMVGDWIRVGTDEGTVVDISVRATKIKTIDGTEVFLPNRTIYGGVVENKTAFKERRYSVEMLLPAGSDFVELCAACEQAAKTIPGVLANPEVTSMLTLEGSGNMRLHLYYWVERHTDINRLSTQLTTRLQSVIASRAAQ